MTQSLTEQLLTTISEKTFDDDDLSRAWLHITDWLGCASLGAQSAVGNTYAQQLSIAENPNENKLTTAIWQGKSHWQDSLAFNAAMGNILEMDDIHRSSILHPGPVVIPAALTVAEQQNLSVVDMLKAIIKGYEVTIRLGESVGASHYRYFHNTSTCAAAGASVAASDLLTLSIEQYVWALGNTLSRTGGLWQMRNEVVMTKPWHNAEAAKSGVSAAHLAKSGLTGPRFILEGEQGLFAAFSNDANHSAFNKPADSWRIFDCSFKPWAACRHAHPVIDCMMELLGAYPQIRIEDIASIDANVYRDSLVFCDKPAPETELQAKFSIQHAIAIVLLKGEPKLEHFYPETFKHSAVVALRQKVKVNHCNEVQQRYPEHYGCECVLTLNNGSVFRRKVTDTLGDPEKPMTEKQLGDKAKRLMQSAGVTKNSVDAFMTFDWRNASVRQLCSLLQHKIYHD